MNVKHDHKFFFLFLLGKFLVEELQKVDFVKTILKKYKNYLKCLKELKNIFLLHLVSSKTTNSLIIHHIFI